MPSIWTDIFYLSLAVVWSLLCVAAGYYSGKRSR